MSRVDINGAYEAYKSNPQEHKDAFGRALLEMVTRLVRSHYWSGLVNYGPTSTLFNLEDSIGDAMLYVWENLDKYDPARSSFSSFVHLVTQTQIKRAFRTLKKHQASRFVEETYTRSDLGLLPTEKLLLKGLIKALKPEEASMAHMKLDGLENTEIASALGISSVAVEQRWKRILKKMRQFSG